eukprot:TRINITY_DN15121_c0_g1_i1.p1 TRINITY_DN15121_c0_g1~~TRINITY_DN15121_c0_g1_i1.p1  ORF type:complete len:336 (+),score=34.66 TRINITY_DN15121_c0_g1_i1:95-1102(+)
MDGMITIKMEEKNRTADDSNLDPAKMFQDKYRNFANEFNHLVLWTKTEILASQTLSGLGHKKSDEEPEGTKDEESYKREPSDPTDFTSKPKKRRRRRHEIIRNFKCPEPSCNKSYGSEGALKTHVRLKHTDGAGSVNLSGPSQIPIVPANFHNITHPNLPQSTISTPQPSSASNIHLHQEKARSMPSGPIGPPPTPMREPKHATPAWTYSTSNSPQQPPPYPPAALPSSSPSISVPLPSHQPKSTSTPSTSPSMSISPPLSPFLASGAGMSARSSKSDEIPRLPPISSFAGDMLPHMMHQLPFGQNFGPRLPFGSPPIPAMFNSRIFDSTPFSRP